MRMTLKTTQNTSESSHKGDWAKLQENPQFIAYTWFYIIRAELTYCQEHHSIFIIPPGMTKSGYQSILGRAHPQDGRYILKNKVLCNILFCNY